MSNSQLGRRLIAAFRRAARAARIAKLRYEHQTLLADASSSQKDAEGHAHMAEALRARARQSTVQAATLQATINHLTKEA